MRVYAIVNVDSGIISSYELTLINNPDDYETSNVVYTEIEGEIPTYFSSCDELLGYWTPYNGEFEETLVDDNLEFVIKIKISNYKLGKLVNERYEEI